MGLFGNSGKKYLNKIEPMLQQYYQPYQQAGGQALGQLQGQFGQMAMNPGQSINDIGQSFQQSPGYDFALQQALMAGGNAAASQGMAGSPQHMQQNMATATGLANQDYYNWLGHAEGQQGLGLQGLGGISQMGYGANGDLAQSIMSSLMSKAGLQNQRSNATQSAVLGTLGTLGGAAIGGPFGAAMGASLFGGGGGFNGGNGGLF